MTSRHYVGYKLIELRKIIHLAKLCDDLRLNVLNI
jgi:hypothetical protein